jgi:glycosyltransferase involved in cell wall biosynthesis
MKIGFYAIWGMGWDGHTLTGFSQHIRYLEHFLAKTDGVRLFTDVINNRPLNTERLSHPNLEVVEIPWRDWAKQWRHHRDLRRLFAANLDGLDAMYVRLYDPCPWVLAPLCEKQGIGMVFHIVVNPIVAIRHRHDWTWAGKRLRRAMFFPEEFLIRRCARRHTILINGSENTRFFARHGLKGEMVISSTLVEDDFYERQDTCLREEKVVLHAGFIRPWKHPEILIDAVAQLMRAGRKVKLRLVGPVEPEIYTQALEERIRRQGIADRVEWGGFVPGGAPLNEEYRAADIFAFPSGTEGSARVLLEAAANALPIITTEVGGVQDIFVEGESALIVPKDQPEAMARGIARFLDDPPLRHRCIRGAQTMAREHTLDAYIQLLVTRLEESRGAGPGARN